MEAIAKKENLVGLTGDDFDYIQRAKKFSRETHREVYRHLFIIVELNKAFEFLDTDTEKYLNEFVENWARWHAADLKPITPTESLVGIAEKLTRQIEKILSDYLPGCQLEVLGKLQVRLPAEEK